MAGILEIIPDSLKFINHAFECDKNVLVHCASGVSRSVAVCASFLTDRYENVDLNSALETISRVRTFANPNLGFRRQLQLLENCNGDVDAAKEMFSKYQSNLVEDTIRQRNIVNELHSRIDDIEVSIASIKSQKSEHNELNTGARLNFLKDGLMNLQVELDSCLPDELIFVDPPAKLIRKAANAKIEHLLRSIAEH
mmetsp:Transcript_16136/g.21043  ORF Transcript_16136/g.21043 Transcript_16136/m.21043 type:complete len:196 (+) Transcript_16136:2-589(+)